MKLAVLPSSETLTLIDLVRTVPVTMAGPFRSSKERLLPTLPLSTARGEIALVRRSYGLCAATLASKPAMRSKSSAKATKIKIERSGASSATT